MTTIYRLEACPSCRNVKLLMGATRASSPITVWFGETPVTLGDHCDDCRDRWDEAAQAQREDERSGAA